MNLPYVAGTILGALIGSVFIGGLFGWIIYRLSLRRVPLPIADAAALTVLPLAASYTNQGLYGFPPILIYGLAAFMAYFILQRARLQSSKVQGIDRRYEPELDRAVAAAILPSTAAQTKFNWTPVRKVAGGILITVLGAIGLTCLFSAVRQVVSPTLFGGSPEFSFLVGAVLLIPCIFIWRGMIR
jgi:hypothetical protein